MKREMTNQERFVLELNNAVKERMIEKEIAEQRLAAQAEQENAEKEELTTEPEYAELTTNGSWYTLELSYDGQFDAFKAHGKAELNNLITDLIHDVKIDGKYNLIPALEGMLKA